MTRRLALVLLFCLTIFGCEGDYTIYDVNPPEVVYVEVPVEVLVDVPGTGGDVWVRLSHSIRGDCMDCAH